MFYDYTSLKFESFEAELINKNNKRDFLFGKFHTNFTCVRHVKHVMRLKGDKTTLILILTLSIFLHCWDWETSEDIVSF